MKRIYMNADVGKKNILFSIVLFLALGVGVGVPLTVNFLGGSVLTQDQYLAWKVLHGYAVFLALINYFYGVMIDRLELTRQQKETSSWSILAAGLCGGIARSILLLLSKLADFGIYASLGETVFIVVGSAIFLLGQLRERRSSAREGAEQTFASHPADLLSARSGPSRNR